MYYPGADAFNKFRIFNSAPGNYPGGGIFLWKPNPKTQYEFSYEWYDG